MAGEWIELPFSSAVEINPSVRLLRGQDYPFVDMASITPQARCVCTEEIRPFGGGGSRFSSGDTLMARITPCLENGKIARFCAPSGVLAHGSTEFIVIRGRDGVSDSSYVYYLTKWEGVYGHAINQMTGTSGRQRVPISALDHLIVPIPPLPEQCAIAHILGTLDDKIELNRRMNETLEAMARALFKSWFVDFDPVRAKVEGRDAGLPKHIADLFPARFVDSELGEIPEGWGVASIADVAEVIDCLHSKKPDRRESGFPMLQLVNIRDDGLLDMTDSYLINEKDYQQWVSRMEATQGDCVITNVGRVGAVAQIPIGLKAALGRNMTGVRCRNDFPFPTVFIEALLSRAMKDEMTNKIDTGTILDALNVRNIPRLRFVRGSYDVLSLFERVCRPLRARMESLLAESHILAVLRDTLLPKLISGELRVKDAEKYIGRKLV